MPENTVEKIASASGLTREEINARVEQKKQELSGLVSEEAATRIVAKELGVELKKEQETLRLENVVPGMQNADIVAKITKKFPPKSFSTKHGEGKVQNVLLADESGSLRMSLWNEEVENFSFTEGDVVRVRGYVKEDNLGGPELRIGRHGGVEKSDAEIRTTVTGGYKRKNIIDLKEGEYASVRAPVIQVFESNVFFEVCPECGTRLDEDNNCSDHGNVEPNYRMVLTGIIDDGTGSIRAVFFNEQAEAVIGVSTREAKRLWDKKNNISAVLEKIELGKEFVLEGSIRRNKLFGRLEFIVNRVNEVDIKKEIRSLLGE